MDGTKKKRRESQRDLAIEYITSTVCTWYLYNYTGPGCSNIQYIQYRTNTQAADLQHHFSLTPYLSLLFTFHLVLSLLSYFCFYLFFFSFFLLFFHFSSRTFVNCFPSHLLRSPKKRIPQKNSSQQLVMLAPV